MLLLVVLPGELLLVLLDEGLDLVADRQQAQPAFAVKGNGPLRIDPVEADATLLADLERQRLDLLRLELLVLRLQPLQLRLHLLCAHRHSIFRAPVIVLFSLPCPTAAPLAPCIVRHAIAFVTFLNLLTDGSSPAVSLAMLVGFLAPRWTL